MVHDTEEAGFRRRTVWAYDPGYDRRGANVPSPEKLCEGRARPNRWSAGPLHSTTSRWSSTSLSRLRIGGAPISNPTTAPWPESTSNAGSSAARETKFSTRTSGGKGTDGFGAGTTLPFILPTAGTPIPSAISETRAWTITLQNYREVGPGSTFACDEGRLPVAGGSLLARHSRPSSVGAGDATRARCHEIIATPRGAVNRIRALG